MRLPEDLKISVCTELQDVSDLMKQAPDVPKALFYYSAVFGVLDRTFKTKFDEDVFAAAFVTQTSYNTLISQWNLNRSGDLTVILEKEGVDSIAEQVAALSQRISKGSEIYPVLRKIMVLTFEQTGPGHYLAERGRIPHGI